jgi:hypothetical protein
MGQVGDEFDSKGESPREIESTLEGLQREISDLRFRLARMQADQQAFATGAHARSTTQGRATFRNLLRWLRRNLRHTQD